MNLDPQTVTANSSPRQRCRETLDGLRQELLAARTEDGHWEGELAASALSTATAISALSAVLLAGSPIGEDDDDTTRDEMRAMIRQGMRYLGTQQRDDGGFGDTDRSHSNIATSYLALSASTLAEKVGEQPLTPASIARLNQYLDGAGRLDGLRRRYGKDKTFVVPIMNNMAIAGLISWDEVAALPFEAAIFPQSMYRFLRMPVVSYAIPALVAIGQARHFLGRRAIFPLRLLRSLCVNRTLDVLQRMQPASGGYLEATPLTAFVVMSLAATGRCDLPVVKNGLKFLKASMLPGGRWPIDTNLATWVTSLSIHALACDPQDDGTWYGEDLAQWHLNCQHRTRHPFTGAEPGGWGWTDLSGAVPDSDDTPAAILSLGLMRPFADDSVRRRIDQASRQGVQWLFRLQNRNGGWPTFCRGWGKLPFDRSSTDLTAHALRALRSFCKWPRLSEDPPDQSMLERAERKGLAFLAAQQNDDGSWYPLWFGNQDRPDETNPIYGTAKVLIAGGMDAAAEDQASAYLIRNQNADGGWGGGPSMEQTMTKLVQEDHCGEFASFSPAIPAGLTSSVEETALAVEALATLMLREKDREQNRPASAAASSHGATFQDVSAGGQSSSAGGRNSSAGGHDRSSRAGGAPKGGTSDDGLAAVSSPEFGNLESDFSKMRSAEPVGGLTIKAGEGFAAGNDATKAAILRGVEFLTRSVEDRRHQIAWPIGFYFAKLWYHERLYPLIFTVAALGKFLRATDEEHDPGWPQ